MGLKRRSRKSSPLPSPQRVRRTPQDLGHHCRHAGPCPVLRGGRKMRVRVVRCRRVPVPHRPLHGHHVTHLGIRLSLWRTTMTTTGPDGKGDHEVTPTSPPGTARPERSPLGAYRHESPELISWEHPAGGMSRVPTTDYASRADSRRCGCARQPEVRAALAAPSRGVSGCSSAIVQRLDGGPLENSD